MIRHLSHNHSVVVASLAHSERELQAAAGLKDYCDELIVEVVPEWVRWPHAFLALPLSQPSSVAYFWSSALYQRIRRRLVEVQYDAIIVHCAFMAQYVTNWTNGYRLLDFGDLDSGKWSAYSKAKAFPLSLGFGVEARKLRRYEANVTRHFHKCSVTTRGELETFQSLAPSTPCTVIPNGVDTSYFELHRVSSAQRPVVVFLGRMDYFPNVDGVCYFVERILPQIREQIPDIEFRIVGSNPVHRIRRLASLPGVAVTGHVPDVRDYLRDAAVSVAPLRIARGTQNKILESMAMGVPVVSTRQAAKGIQAFPGEHFLVADNPAAFAQCVSDLLQKEGLRRRISAAAKNNLQTTHKWPISMKILDGLLQPKVDLIEERHLS